VISLEERTQTCYEKTGACNKRLSFSREGTDLEQTIQAYRKGYKLTNSVKN
jgi:hypothetical protein